jgi:hypothetical protein
MEPPVPLGSVEKATRYIIQRSHRPMADKAPKFARTPLSDPSDLPDLSGAWHLWGVVAIRCQAVVSGPRNAPPSGDRWLPRSARCLAPWRGGSAWFASIGRRSIRCLAPVGRAAPVGRPVSTWFASIRRRSARCLAPLAGRFLPGLPALDGGLSGARHLLAQPGLLALIGRLPGAWHLLAGRFSTWFASIDRRSARCLAPLAGRHLWPGGFSLVCQHWTAGLSGAWHLLGAPGTFGGVLAIRCQAVDSGARTPPPSGDRWLRPDRWLTPGASIDALGANR